MYFDEFDGPDMTDVYLYTPDGMGLRYDEENTKLLPVFRSRLVRDPFGMVVGHEIVCCEEIPEPRFATLRNALGLRLSRSEKDAIHEFLSDEKYPPAPSWREDFHSDC